jgi:hypothetical protein
MKHSIFASITFLSVAISACSPSSTSPSSSGEVRLEFLDSIVVESLHDLFLSSVNEQTGQILFKDRFLKEFLLTDPTGKIITSFSLTGEGPNQVSFPMEVAFMADQLVVKEISAEMKLNFFDSQFKKDGVSPPLASGLNMMEVAFKRQSFSVLDQDQGSLILGVENNAIDPQWMTAAYQKAEFYDVAKTGYIYNLENDSLRYFSLYPDSWQPKLNKEWVGQAFPFMAVLGQQNLIAVLPRVGKQIFFYTLQGQELVPRGETTVFHPDRRDELKIDPMEQPFLYPGFSDIKGGGNYFLLEFFTEIPLDAYQEIRAKSENYMTDPEFKQLMKTYRQERYILLNSEGDQQIISDLPIAGSIHYLDKEDVIYIKPEEVEERDHNVFYRYKILP